SARLRHPLFTFDRPAATGRVPPSLHDALPILCRLRSSVRAICLLLAPEATISSTSRSRSLSGPAADDSDGVGASLALHCCIIARDRKSTRLNSSHVKNSYAVFCLKKKIIR